MAKLTAYQIKKLNDRMVKRMNAKHTNKNNWPGEVMTKSRPKDIQQADEFMYDNKHWKPFKK